MIGDGKTPWNFMPTYASTPATQDMAAQMNIVAQKQLQANQDAIMQAAIKSMQEVVDDKPDDYSFRVSSYPQLTTPQPFFGRIIMDDAPKVKSQPLTYKAFQDIVATTLNTYAPAIKAITDCNGDEFLLWLECKGVKRDRQLYSIHDDEAAQLRMDIENMCDEIEQELGREAVQCR